MIIDKSKRKFKVMPKFKILDKNTPVEVLDFIKDFKNSYPESKISIGCDSQARGTKVNYVIAIALRYPLNKGCRVIQTKIELPKVDNYTRLSTEFELTLEIVEMLMAEGIKVDIIDLDYSQSGTLSSAFASYMNTLISLGFESTLKPTKEESAKFSNKKYLEQSAVIAADHIVRK